MGIAIAACSAGLVACGGGERQDEDEPEGEYPVRIDSAEFPSRQRLAQTSNLTLTVTNTGDEAVPDLAITIFTEAQGADGSGAPGDEADGEESVEGGESVTPGDGEESEDEGEQTGTSPQSQAPAPFSVLSEQEGLALPARPVWVLEQGYPKLAVNGSVADLEAAPPAGAEAVQSNTFSFGPLEPNETREMVWRVTPVQAGNYTIHYRVAAGLQGKAVAVTDDGGVPEGELVVRITDVPPQTRVDESGEVVEIKKGDLIGQAGSGKQRSEVGGD